MLQRLWTCIWDIVFQPDYFRTESKDRAYKETEESLIRLLKEKDEDNGENIDDLKIAMLNK